MDKEIMELLQTIISGMQEMESRINAKMDRQNQETRDDIRSIKLTLENETNKKINLMYESHQSIIAKLDQVEQLDPLKDRVSDAERAIIVHTAQIAELQKA